MTADMARERERRDWERDQQRIMADEEAEERRRKQKEVRPTQAEVGDQWHHCCMLFNPGYPMPAMLPVSS